MRGRTGTGRSTRWRARRRKYEIKQCQSKLSQVAVFVECQRFVRFPIFREVKICQEKDKYKGMCRGVLGRILQFVFRDFGGVMHLILSKAFFYISRFYILYF